MSLRQSLAPHQRESARSDTTRRMQVVCSKRMAGVHEASPCVQAVLISLALTFAIAPFRFRISSNSCAHAAPCTHIPVSSLIFPAEQRPTRNQHETKLAKLDGYLERVLTLRSMQ